MTNGTSTKAHAEAARIAILTTADELRRTIATLLEPLGITLQQYNVLSVLRAVHPDPLTTRDIGERLAAPTPGTTRLLERLERKRLIRRERPAANRRIVLCRLEPAGLALLGRADAAIDRLDQSIGDALATDQLAGLAAALAAVGALNIRS